MRTRSAVLVLVLTVLALVGAALPASAHVTQFTMNAFHRECPNGCDTFVVDQAFGSITCTPGERFVVRVRVGQPATRFRAFGTARGTCTGSEQDWTANLRHDGTAVCGEPIRFQLSAQTFVNGEPHGTADSFEVPNTVTCT